MTRFPVLAVAVALLIATVPQRAEAAPIAALPATIRVNIAGLGTTYAKIGSTGTVTVTRADGSTLYRGAGQTVSRRGVRRLADQSRSAAKVPDPVTSRQDRLNRAMLFRQARLAARVEDVAIVSIAFEFSVESTGVDPLAPPLFSSGHLEDLHFATSDGLLTYNGRAYRGTLDLTTDDEGDMIVVNQVDTASYLASVVGSEEPTSWAPEALASQAIAARTYLVTHMGKHDRYDLEGDTRDQEYDGLAGEDRATLRAVERTAGLVATYAGRPIEALYSANAGGITEDSENVYASALPYLRSVASPSDEVAQASSWGHTSWQWQTEFTATQLRSYLGARGVDVGDPQRIELTRVTGTGRVASARIVGSSGTREIGKDTSRYYFGLRSSLFTVASRAPETEIVGASDADRVRQIEQLGATIDHVLASSVHDPDRGARKITGFVYRLPARFVFQGKGYGHGVGMSQWGAQGMALAGASAEQILKHYYTGIEITKVGGA